MVDNKMNNEEKKKRQEEIFKDNVKKTLKILKRKEQKEKEGEER